MSRDLGIKTILTEDVVKRPRSDICGVSATLGNARNVRRGRNDYGLQPTQRNKAELCRMLCGSDTYSKITSCLVKFISSKSFARYFWPRGVP